MEKNEVRVHSGFYQAFISVEDFIIKKFRETNKPVIFTGHSLGGAIGLTALALSAFVWNPFSVLIHRIVTFGQPRVGGPRFANLLNHVYGNRYYRVISGSDAVPRQPGKIFGYCHAGNIIYIDNDGMPHLNPSQWFMFRDRFLTFHQRFTDHSMKSQYEKPILSYKEWDSFFNERNSNELNRSIGKFTQFSDRRNKQI